MRTFDSINDALSLYSAPSERQILTRFGGWIRTYWNAMRDGLAAARAYYAMTSRGVPHDVAARHVFSEHFQAR
jgi:hypothetical protein